MSPSFMVRTAFCGLLFFPPPRARRRGRPALQLFQNAVETLETRLPDRPIPLEPRVCLGKRFSLEAARPSLRILAGCDEARPLEDLQVLGNCGLADRERFRELCH